MIECEEVQSIATILEKMYDIQTNPLLSEEYPNLSVVSTLHQVECDTPSIVPFVAIKSFI